MASSLGVEQLASLGQGGQWDYQEMLADFGRGLAYAGIAPGNQDPRENALRHVLHQGTAERLLGRDAQGRIMAALSYYPDGDGEGVYIDMVGSLTAGGGGTLVEELARRYPQAALRCKPLSEVSGFWRKLGFQQSQGDVVWTRAVNWDALAATALAQDEAPRV